MSELPDGWLSAPIGDLCLLRNGRAFKPTEWVSSGLPIVRIQNLNNKTAPFNHYQGEFDSKYYLKGGELLFAWSGTPGTSFGAHIWHGGEAVLNQHIFRVDFEAAAIDKRFFKSAINQKLNALIGMAQGGVGLRHVTKGVFEATEISLPPLPEQTRIANKLDTLLARVDSARDRLDRVPGMLKRFRQAVLTAATSGVLTEAWREERELLGGAQHNLGQILKVGSGKFLPSKAMAPGGRIPVYGGNGVNGYHDQANVSQKTIVIGRVGFYCGCVHMTPDQAWVTDNALIVRHDQSTIDRAFLFLALQALDLRENDSSTAQPVISGQKIYALTITIPTTLPEQTEIVRQVEILFAYADRLEARLKAARKLSESLSPAILAKAFRGELVAQDPNDEPAAELLKRIRAGRK